MDPIRYFGILLIFFLTSEVDTYRILGIFPLEFKSHNMFFEAIMKGLARRGHKVDVITHHELSNPPENYTTVLNLAKLDFPYPITQFGSIDHGVMAVSKKLGSLSEVYGTNMCKLLGHKKLQDFITNSPKDPAYDLIIVEGWGFSCFYGLGHLWNVPVVTVTPSLEFPWISAQIKNPLSTAFYPTFLLSKASVKTFWDRLKNTLISHAVIHTFFHVTEKPQTELMRKFLSPDMPSVREVERMVALSIVNTYHTIQGVRPTTPAFIEVGGLHIEEDKSTFTKELKKWMDESKNGVVYVSFGSLLPIETLPKETILSIYSSFSKIAPVRVLMKADKGLKFPPGLPKNVLTKTWIPQIPVLRHKNTRLFITHGGIHSVQETIYHGIPCIGIPIVYDQIQNIEILVNKKMAMQINREEITEKSLDEALRATLNDPKYREAAKKQSRLFRDRPMSPIDTATYWIEYVIKNGAQSLRSPAVDMYWWQVELLDVYLFLLLCFLFALYLILFTVKVCFKIFSLKIASPKSKRD